MMWFQFFKIKRWAEALFQLVFKLKLWNTDFLLSTHTKYFSLFKVQKKKKIVKKTWLKCPVISGQILYIFVCVCMCFHFLPCLLSTCVNSTFHHWKVNIFPSIKKKAFWVVYRVITGVIFSCFHWFLFQLISS